MSSDAQNVFSFLQSEGLSQSEGSVAGPGLLEARPAFYILDAFSLIFQVFHAIPEMAGPAGQPTQAVFGIFRDLLNLLKIQKPDYLAAAFDGAGPVFRSEIDPQYKANRAEMPPDLVPQIPVIRRVFEGFRVPVLVEPEMEADDVIATLTRRAEERGLDVFIVTADKDARQLISDQVRILNLRTKKIMDAAGLEKEWGIRPDQVVDFLSLTGDAVDNVPGVPGIGAGYASTFLKEFGTLDQLLANVDHVKGPKKQQSLRDHAETARRARAAGHAPRRPSAGPRLGRPQDPAAGPRSPADDLHRVRIPPVPRRAGNLGPAGEPPPGRPSLGGRVPRSSIPRNCSARSSTNSDGSPGSASTPRPPRSIRSRRTWSGCRFAGRPAKRITCRCAGRPGRDCSTRRRHLRPCGRSWPTPPIEKVGQNIKYDMLALARAGVELAGPVTDTMVLSYLLESGERNHNLDQLSQRLLDHTMIPITDLIGKGKNQLRMDQVAVDRRSPSTPARTPTRPGGSRRSWRPRCVRRGSGTLYAELERPLIAVLAGMERPAWPSTSNGCGNSRREFAERIATIETEIYQAGRPDVQHQLGPAASPGALRGAEAAVAPENARRRTEHGAGRPGGAGPQAPVSGSAPAASPARQAQEHLPGRTARCWCIPRTAGFTPRSTRAWPRRAGSARATPTCRISRSAPRTAGRSARRSSPAGRTGGS